MSQPNMPLSNISDYTILNVLIPPISSFPKQSIHTIYVRPHVSRAPSENDSRSIFLVNVPIDSTPSHFRAIFASLIGPGRFESIYFNSENRLNDNRKLSSFSTTNYRKRKMTFVENCSLERDLPDTWDRKLRKSGDSAIVLLVDEKSVEKLIKAIKKLHKHQKSSDNWPIWGDTISSSLVPLGSTRYMSHHNLRFPDPIKLQSYIDEYMTEFNNREKFRRELDKKARNEPDADGFVTVSRGGRTGPARKEVVEEKMALLEERESKKRDQMQKAGFYRFQGREKRKAEADELLRRFDEDKKKIQALREKRGKAGFTPEG